MVTFVFDSSAVLRYLDRQAGAVRVREILQHHALRTATMLISAVQWGEIARIVYKRQGAKAVPDALTRLLALGVEVVPVSAQDAVGAAIVKNTLRLSYADAFAVVLAQEHQHSVLVTADYDFKLAEHLTLIEFLPPNLP